MEPAAARMQIEMAFAFDGREPCANDRIDAFGLGEHGAWEDPGGTGQPL